MIRALGWLGIAFLWSPVLAGFLLEGPEGLRWPSVRQLSLLGSSIGYAALVGLLSCGFGVNIALWSGRLRPSFRNLLLVVLTGAAALPSVVIATPSLILALRAMPRHSQGVAPALAVQVLAFTPICSLIAMLAASALPKDQIEAARLLPSPARALFRAVLPMLAPGLAACFGAAFLLSIVDFTIPSIFNWNTYSLEAFTEISAGRPAMGSCAPLLALGLAGSAACGRWLSRLVWTESSLGSHAVPMPGLCRAAGAAAGCAFLIVVLGMFVGLGAEIESVSAAVSSIVAASGDAAASLKINAAVCALSLALASVVAPLLMASRSWVPWALTLAPFAFLPTMVGIVFAQLGVRLGLQGVWLPALALSIRTAPVAAVLLAVWFGQIDRGAIDSARVFLGASKRFLRVYARLAVPSLAMAACLAFLMGLGDVGAMLLVVQPGESTLSVRLYNYLHYGSALDSTVISFVIMGMAMGLALVFVRAGRKA